MVQYVRNLEEVPAFSNIPLPGHENSKTVDKILIDPVTGSKNFMLLWCQDDPASGTEMHAHSVEQAYFVLSGEFRIRIGDQEYDARANSAVFIPAGVRHAIIDHGKEPAVMLLVFSPPISSFASSPH